MWGNLIAVLSFILSLVTLYTSRLAPFLPLVAQGTPKWRYGCLRDKPHPVLTICLPLVVSNLGARAGLVYDMILKLRCAEETWNFVPMFLLNAEQGPRGGETTVSCLDTLAEEGAPLFRPFILAPYQQVERVVMFWPSQGGEVLLRSGTYKMTLDYRAVPAAPSEGWVQRSMQVVARRLGIAERSTAKYIGDGWWNHVVGSFKVTDEDISWMREGKALERVSEEVWDARKKNLDNRS